MINAIRPTLFRVGDIDKPTVVAVNNFMKLHDLTDGTNNAAKRILASDPSNIEVPVGIRFFHGTDLTRRQWNPEQHPIDTPAWFTDQRDWALEFSNRMKFHYPNRNNKPVLLTYETTRILTLLDLSDPRGETTSVINDLHDEYLDTEVASIVCDMDYDGWFVAHDEIMVCSPNSIRLIQIEHEPS